MSRVLLKWLSLPILVIAVIYSDSSAGGKNLRRGSQGKMAELDSLRWWTGVRDETSYEDLSSEVRIPTSYVEFFETVRWNDSVQLALSVEFPTVLCGKTVELKSEKTSFQLKSSDAEGPGSRLLYRLELSSNDSALQITSANFKLSDVGLPPWGISDQLVQFEMKGLLGGQPIHIKKFGRLRMQSRTTAEIAWIDEKTDLVERSNTLAEKCK